MGLNMPKRGAANLREPDGAGLDLVGGAFGAVQCHAGEAALFHGIQ